MLSALLCITVSCSKDDSDGDKGGDSQTSLLEGVWDDYYYDRGNEYEVQERLIFKADGTGSWRIDYYYEDTDELADQDFYNFKYTFDGKTLVMNLSNGTVKTFYVLLLTKDALNLSPNGKDLYGDFERYTEK